MTTIASSSATAIAIGTSTSSPSARLDAPTAVTNRISSVAYAVDEIASDENTASAITFGDPLVLLLGRRERTTDQEPLDRAQPRSSGARADERVSMPLVASVTPSTRRSIALTGGCRSAG